MENTDRPLAVGLAMLTALDAKLNQEKGFLQQTLRIQL
jgi:hypothetical protein